MNISWGEQLGTHFLKGSVEGETNNQKRLRNTGLKFQSSGALGWLSR